MYTPARVGNRPRPVPPPEVRAAVRVAASGAVPGLNGIRAALRAEIAELRAEGTASAHRVAVRLEHYARLLGD